VRRIVTRFGPTVSNFILCVVVGLGSAANRYGASAHAASIAKRLRYMRQEFHREHTESDDTEQCRQDSDESEKVTHPVYRTVC
jgi:hypothetical protein